MEAAAHGHSTLGIPKSVGQEFVAADAGTFDESKHPRGEDGKFGSGGGGSSSESSSPKMGPFGPILTNFRGDAQGAIKALTEMQDGEAIGALHHPEIGDIDLVWGQPGTGNSDGYGLSKIVEFHPEVLGDLQGILGSMTKRQAGKNRIRLESPDHEASVRLSWDGEAKSWLLTAYEKEEKGAANPRTNTADNKVRGDSLERAPEDIVDQVLADFQDQKNRGITELDVAKSIRDGALPSPQQYENVWLFDLRITGTGTSYRMALDEYVYRPPENFLTDEFLERCNGLPVIFEHPEKSILSTEEYRARAIGTIVLPYIKGDEVWGIAKVFDADAAALMCSTHASTSPAVIFRDAGSAESVEVDGKSVLIEGKPSYLDHLAVCQEGVWDKGGEPSGVNTGDPEMDGMEEQVPAWADALRKSVDSVCARMDAIENKGGDQMPANPMAADGNPAAEAAGAAEHEHEAAAARELAEAEAAGAAERRADAAEPGKEPEKPKKEDEERADSAARADAQGRLERENAELRARIERMDGRITSMTKPLSTEDRDALATAQMRADSVMQMFGQSAAMPLHGESPIDYRRRLAAKLQSHSSDMKGVKLDSIDGPAFKLVEDRIYADAQSAALNPAAAPAGRLIPLVSRDEAGRQITRFTGDIDAWMGHFKAPGVVCKVNRQAKGA
ncbi:putative barnase/colicin E5 family endoribonuclease [Burkholderia gladioli]|uniref:putative barnase/colicin E5 family endoribonuclease n=1 Tax=Burkholderia gladioli TaxID=28095 RepID=UPI0034DAFCD9